MSRSHSSLFRSVLCATLGLCGAVSAQAQAQAQAQGAPAEAPSAPTTLPAVIVTGNPLRASTLAQPASVLAADALSLRKGSTLGETLDGLPGVAASYFGPNANRPVVRGQDGDRIRVLGNGGASIDASALSFDHAVPIDPLAIERIEVLRGPAALLYGGSAVGGVVNAIDNRIPKGRLEAGGGSVEVRAGGPAVERGAGARVEGGSERFALHADGFWRDTDDLRVPAFERPSDSGGQRSRRVVNSASRARGGALGGSLLWEHGYLGVSVDSYRNRYGVVAEDDVTIRMQRDKYSLAGEVRALPGWFEAVRVQAAYADYRHAEIEGDGAVGTLFGNEGGDARVELQHRAVSLGHARLRGVAGWQGESTRFSALGEEAFVPGTRTRQHALFVLEELSLGQLTLTAGLRGELNRVSSRGDAADAVEPRFGAAASRRFDTGSTAIGAVFRPAAGWQLSANLASTGRAPASYELFANGVHVATAAFERGDATLGVERSTNVDLGLQWKVDGTLLRAAAWRSRFDDYIALLRTGEPDVVTDDGDAVPVFAFTAVPARLRGLELEAQWPLLEGPLKVDLDGTFDLVRAERTDTGEPLPRIAPRRLTVGAAARFALWRGRVEVRRAARQSRVPAEDVATPGYTIVNLSISRTLRLGQSDALLFARLDNVGNELAFNASTISTVRELAPLPGRRLAIGLRASF